MKTQDNTQNSLKELKLLYNLLRNMADTMPDMLWAKNINGKFTFANEGICKKLLNAKDTQEPIGKNVMFFVNREREKHKEDKEWFTFSEECADSDSEVIKSGRLGQFYGYGNVFGKFLYLDIYKAPLYNDNGKMIGTVGSARDITKEKSIEEKLEESEEKYRAIVENSHDGIYIYRDDNFLFVNNKITELLGYSKKEIMKSDIWNLIHPKDRERLKDYGKKRAKGIKAPSMYSARVVKKNGEILYCEFAVTNILINNEYAALGAVRDVTKRKIAEQLLYESELKLRSLFNAMTEIVFEMDYEGRYIYIAPTSQKLMYMPPDKIVGKKLHDIFPKAQADVFLNVIQKCLDDKKNVAIEYPLKINDKTYWFEGKVSVKTENTVIYIAHDITAKKHVEEELKKHRDNLEQKVEIRTKELENEKQRIEEINELFVGREIRMIELKNKIIELEERLGEEYK